MAGVRCRGYSLPLERAVADLGADVPFGKVGEKVKEHYGIVLPICAARTLTEGVACDLAESDYLPALQAANDSHQLIAETDGGMVPIVETRKDVADARKGKMTFWREAKVCIVQRQGDVMPKVGVTMAGPAEAGAILKRLAEALGFNAQTEVHCVGDGAPWICAQIEEQFGAQGSFLVDLFHVCEYLAPAGAICAPQTAKEWLKCQKARLLTGQAPEVLAALVPHFEPSSVEDAQAPVRVAWRYISNRLDQLDYPRALDLKLPIGSGAVESSHRYLVQARLKRPGAWWLVDMAQAMLNLRVMRHNQMWDAYWEKRRAAPMCLAA